MKFGESSKIIDSFYTTTTRVTSTLETVKQNSLEYLRRQQELIRQHLEHQQILNNNLYESLLNTADNSQNSTSFANLNGLLATSTSAMSSNLLDLLRQHRGMSSSNMNSNTGSAMAAATNTNSNYGTSTLSSIGFNNNGGGVGGADLASMLPLGDLFSNLNSIFEKLFGTKFWIYALVAILTGLIFTFLACFCMYCCCCSRLGRYMFCCCRHGSCFSLSKSSMISNTKSKKKKKKIVDDMDSKCKMLKCCV